MEKTESKSGRTRKRSRSISIESSVSKLRECGRPICEFIKLMFRNSIDITERSFLPTGDDILTKWAFTCAHCYSTNGRNDWYANKEKVHKHWQNNHRKADLPFRFYVDCTVQCYRCGHAGFSEEIQHHARTKHKEFSVFIKYKRDRQCALCSHRKCNGNIPDHFRRVHSDELVSMDVLNLIPFLYSDLMDLTAIGEYHLRCSYCKRLYAKRIDFDQHQRAKHPGEQQKYGEVKLICCFCEKSIQSDDFLVHVKKCGIFKCNNCRNFQAKTPETFLNHIKELHSNDLSHGSYSKLRRSLMDKYFSTRCIFENGLVVTKRNLINLGFDDREEFMNLIAESVAELRTLAKRSGLKES